MCLALPSEKLSGQPLLALTHAVVLDNILYVSIEFRWVKSVKLPFQAFPQVLLSSSVSGSSHSTYELPARSLWSALILQKNIAVGRAHPLDIYMQKHILQAQC